METQVVFPEKTSFVRLQPARMRRTSVYVLNVTISRAKKLNPVRSASDIANTSRASKSIHAVTGYSLLNFSPFTSHTER